jgi:hypothetical protein
LFFVQRFHRGNDAVVKVRFAITGIQRRLIANSVRRSSSRLM